MPSIQDFDVVRRSVERRDRVNAKNLVDRLRRKGVDVIPLRDELEEPLLALVKPIPAADHQANLDSYELLAALDPEDVSYRAKGDQYLAQAERLRKSVVEKLTRKEDKIEGVTWFQHPNQPRYLNSRSTVYIYIGQRGSNVRPF